MTPQWNDDLDNEWRPRRTGESIMDFVAISFTSPSDHSRIARVRAAYAALNKEIADRRSMWEDYMSSFGLKLRVIQVDSIKIEADFVEANVRYETVHV